MSSPGLVATFETATSAETLVKRAHQLLADSGVTMSPSKVSRLVRTFKNRVEANGAHFENFLVNSALLTAEQRRKALQNPDIARYISYPDKTGEDATDVVLKLVPITKIDRRGPRVLYAESQR